jgi:hypothetical protein
MLLLSHLKEHQKVKIIFDKHLHIIREDTVKIITTVAPTTNNFAYKDFKECQNEAI